MPDTMPDTAVDTAPDAGDIVHYQGRYHVVHGWLRRPDTDDAEPRRLLFATRANATHVRLHNVETGPTVARVTHVTPTGDQPAFAPNTIRAAHRMAETLDGQLTDQVEDAPDAEEKP